MNDNELEVLQHYWQMSADKEVGDLQKQLQEGLIHPVEFAQQMLRIARRYGIQVIA